MNFIEITEKDLVSITKFQNTEDESINPYGIDDPVFLQLYDFYKSRGFEQNYYYVYAGSTPLTEIIDVSREYTYNIYGIYRDKRDVSEERHQLGIIEASWLRDEETFSCEWNANRIFDFTLGDVIVEKNYSNTDSAEREKDAKVMASVDEISINKVLNDYFITYETFKATASQLQDIEDLGYQIIDVSEFFNSFQNLQDPDIALGAIENLKDYLRKVNAECKNPCVFYYKEEKSGTDQIFLALAALLTTTEGMHFFIPNDMKNVYYEYVYMLNCRDGYYCDEYLDFLFHFPIYTVKLKENSGYFYQKSLEALAFDKRKSVNERKYSIKLKVYCAPVEIKGTTINRTGSFLKGSTELCYDSIDILSMRDFIGITGLNVEDSRKRVAEINNIMYLNTLDLYKCTPVNNTMLHAGNTIIFKDKGDSQWYLGCVLNIQYTLPFVVIPMDSNYRPFMQEIHLSGLRNLLDYHIFFDAEDKLKRFSVNSQKNSKARGISVDYSKGWSYVHDSAALKGFVLKAIEASKYIIRSSILSYEDIAMWGLQTSQFRKPELGILSDVLNPKEMLKSGILNFYGGPHPMDTTSIVIKDSYWRG